MDAGERTPSGPLQPPPVPSPIPNYPRLFRQFSSSTEVRPIRLIPPPPSPFLSFLVFFHHAACSLTPGPDLFPLRPLCQEDQNGSCKSLPPLSVASFLNLPSASSEAYALAASFQRKKIVFVDPRGTRLSRFGPSRPPPPTSCLNQGFPRVSFSSF